MKPKDILTKDFLTKHYIEYRKSDLTIAQELGLKSHHSVYQARQRHGIYRSSLKDNSHIITKEFLQEYYIKQNKLCSLSGISIDFHKPGEKYTAQTASVDRIDSSLGYTIDNVRWAHKDINYMKMDLTDDRFFYLCREVIKHQHMENQ